MQRPEGLGSLLVYMHVRVNQAGQGPPRSRRTIAFVLIAVLIGIALPLAIVESVLHVLPVMSSTGTMVVDDANPVIRYTPNQPFTFSKGWQFSIVNTGHINNYGFINDQDYTRPEERGPLVVIGDSYVEAKMVPYEQTVQGRLGRLLEQRANVYSIGISGSQLAQYLVFAQYAWTEFHPAAMVFVIVGNDFDESLIKYKNEPGYHYFQAGSRSDDLKLVRIDYRPDIWKKLLRKSALARYLWGTVGIGAITSLIPQRFEHGAQFVGNTAAYASEDRLADSRRVVDRFLLELPQRVPLEKSRILFVLDAMRPEIYSDSDLSRAKGSYFDVMRRYFLERVQAHGYEVIDMQPIFISRHRGGGARFEFALDAHWNGLGHQEAADAIASSGVLKFLMSH